MTNTTLSISVLSGKGGVGKTNIALNLACALHQMGFRCLLMDCDMGLANLDVLLGITPEHTLQDSLLGTADIADILYPIAPEGQEGLDILPAASGVPELIDLAPQTRDALLERLAPVLGKYDFVLLDMGAGIAETVQSFAALTAMRLIVITPEPTSLTDSYALIKVLTRRYGMRDFLVIVNQIESKKEESQTFQRLYAACKRFLDVEPVLLGGIRADPKLQEAVRRQEPLMRWDQGAPASVDIQALAGKVQQLRLHMLDYLALRDVLSFSTAAHGTS